MLKRFRLTNGLIPHKPFASNFDIFDQNLFQEYPKVDISETNQEFNIKADVPGFSKKDIELDIRGNVLFLKGQLQQQSDQGLIHQERVIEFHRQVPLNSSILKENVKAQLQNGVLSITIPKVESKDTTIPIE
jgi:HSP20 family protein